MISGSHNIISGNHFFQGDPASSGLRSAGIVMCLRACNSQITGNYVDNCFIEWTNEREPDPDFTGGWGFAGLSITNNVMLCSNVPTWFSFIVVKPYGSGHRIYGMNATGNTFRSSGIVIDRAERVDASFAPLVLDSMRSVHFGGNTYHNVHIAAANPLVVRHAQNSAAPVWQVETGAALPFDGYAMEVESVVTRGAPRNGLNAVRHHMPCSTARAGASQNAVQLTWPESMRGEVSVRVRMDV